MRFRTDISNRLRSAAACVASAGMVFGCAHASQSGTSAAPLVVGAGSLSRFSFAADARPLHESHTRSFALDRIDQRGLPLDHTYRHTGTGRGVTVYVFDGGVLTTHPDLVGRVRVGYSAFPDDPKICNAHGTAVAGAIAGTTLGVAPEAEIVDVKMVECARLRGTIRGIVDGAHWVIKDHLEHGGPAVANWSFIADTAARIPALDTAVAELRAAGIPVIVSAGNVDMNACRISPANSDGTIVVGASAVAFDTTGGVPRWRDARAPGTAWGPCVDVYAPGDSVLLPSIDRDMRPTAQLWNGTSMSAGYVSGAAALFLEAHPDATPDEVADYLRATATVNSIPDVMSPVTRMLYVGPIGVRRTAPLRSVAEVRAEMGLQ